MAVSLGSASFVQSVSHADEPRAAIPRELSRADRRSLWDELREIAQLLERSGCSRAGNWLRAQSAEIEVALHRRLQEIDEEASRLQAEAAALRRTLGAPIDLAVEIRVIEFDCLQLASKEGAAILRDAHLPSPESDDFSERLMTGTLSRRFVAEAIRQTFARELSRAIMVVAAGEKGRFFSGGEHPTPGFIPGEVPIERSGLSVSVTPRLVTGNSVAVEIEHEDAAKVADVIVQAGGVTAPVIDRQRVRTTLRATLGRTYILGGFRQVELPPAEAGAPAPAFNERTRDRYTLYYVSVTEFSPDGPPQKDDESR